MPEVAADAARTGQVLSNLLTNALAYTPAGGMIRLSAAAGDGEVTVSILDSGPGVPEEHAAYLFERFYRADPARTRGLGRRNGGAGLGLAISQAYIEGQGGRIWLETGNIREGALFCFTLPAAGHHPLS
ncbi:MAG: sensor histidine kinase [Candidatus Promineifilaceae bacterium]